VLLKTADVLCGPFKYTVEPGENQYRLCLQPLPPNPDLPGDHTPFTAYNFKSENYTFLRTAADYVVLSHLAGLFEKRYSPIDFMSDDQLVNWAKDLACVNAGRESAKELNALRQRIRGFKGEISAFDRDRSQRFVQLLDRLDIWDQDKLFARYVDTDEGKLAVVRYLDAHQESILEIAATRFHSELRESKALIERDIATLNSLKCEIQQQCSDLIVERDNAESIRDADQIELTKLKSRLEDLNREIEARLSTNKQLEVVHGGLQRNLLADNERLAERLTELKPLLDLLRGRDTMTTCASRRMPSISQPKRLREEATPG